MATETSTRLALVYAGGEGQKISNSVPHATPGLDAETVYAAMEAMVETTVLVTADGVGAETPYSAKYIQTITQELF